MTRDLTVELKQLRLHGMAGAWSDLMDQGANAGLDSSRWLLEHLLQAEGTDRAMRSVSHQMHAARFPVHRDIAGFDFEVSPVDRKLVSTLAATTFTDDGEAVRAGVNQWIRSNKSCDGVFDFDAALRDPKRPTKIREELQSGDYLHPNAAGYKAMADSIDLSKLRSEMK